MDCVLKIVILINYDSLSALGIVEHRKGRSTAAVQQGAQTP